MLLFALALAVTYANLAAPLPPLFGSEKEASNNIASITTAFAARSSFQGAASVSRV